MKKKFLLCSTCGNIVEIIDDKGIMPYCCKEAMKELTPNTKEAAFEKHIPVVAVKDNTATVTIGEVLHPMSEEHYIAWIYVETDKKALCFNLKPGDDPVVEFTLDENEIVESAWAYCNLHGLWTNN